MNASPIQCLLSLPPGSAAHAAQHPAAARPGMFCASDPPGVKLGSAGGSLQMLVEAWRATGADCSFSDWLAASRKLIVLGGGQSRRLPAYAAEGKPFIPIPALQGTYGQRLDQTLLDLQLEAYRGVLARAPKASRVMITSGDVLLTFDAKLPPCPDVDVLMLGMEVAPEVATHFGVFFFDRTAPERLAFFLQKPARQRIRILSTTHHFLVDTGMWLLSERAVEVLLRRCGWDESAGAFAKGHPETYELYSQFGLALGDTPQVNDPEIQTLTCRAVALPHPQFYHLGTSRQLIESVCQMQNREALHMAAGSMARVYPNRVVQNAVIGGPLPDGGGGALWIENAAVPASWRLGREHVITGAPANAWDLELESGACLDFAPIGERDFCVRPYGIDDAFSGALGEEATLWLGRPARAWFEARGLSFEAAGIDPQTDIFQAPLFPVLAPEALDPRFIEWLCRAEPENAPQLAERWLKAERLSAEQLNARTNLARLKAQRAENRLHALDRLYINREHNVFHRLDLDQTARLYAATDRDLPPLDGAEGSALGRIHDHMWRAAVLRQRGQLGAEREEDKAFACLREAILANIRAQASRPQCNVLADQIVWGRAPARLDFAGGWTDTPPYCLQHGGNVVNIAVDLNGQPPIQVFAKLSEKHEIVIRSIDLGVEQRITSYEELETYSRVGSDFALAKAALVLAGFGAQFYGASGLRTLQRQLAEFGGGIELSLLAAIPQGSGLGTSSILAATLLGALSELCGLHWDTQAIMMRTMALEQMLTTGGGWQDQAGGILHGVKQCRTAPGMRQEIITHWLPGHLFSEARANGQILLYYTGVTRLAKNILQEIVRGMFLNEGSRLGILREIGENADFAADAIQRASWEDFCESVRRSWRLNQRLDSGTNPPAIQAILDPVQDYLAGVKLLGAGGGGYMVMLAKDEEAAQRIRRKLSGAPPNNKARFVELSTSRLGLEITRS